MPLVQLSLTPAQFTQLPRNAAYRYHYDDGQAWLNPRPRFYHAILDLPPNGLEGAAAVDIAPFDDEHDWEPLVELFAEAFRHQQPFGGLSDGTRQVAVRRSLDQTRLGGDGPWIEEASYVAMDGDGLIAGAVLITLLPLRDPTEWGAYHWNEPPPEDCIEKRLGRPHLTWIFVHPDLAARGVGTALLREACNTLVRMGFDSLLSTFMLGNDTSMLWHWRMGFRLLAHPASRRRPAEGP
jgi:GNAT superfamily N-acetyltransferase